jgi:hypothetical protein
MPPNVLAVEFRQWCARLWQGRNRAYTIVFLTVVLSSLCWFLGSRTVPHRDTWAEKHRVPEDA